MKTSSDRLTQRNVRISVRRPDPPRDPVFDPAINQVSWTPPTDTALITHYRIRLGYDTAVVTYQPAVGQTSVQVGPGVTRMFLSSYNQTTDTESEFVLLDIDTSNAWFTDEIIGLVEGAQQQPQAPEVKLGPFVRTFLVKDSTIGTDVADSVYAFGATVDQPSTIRRIGAVLRKAITADLTVKFTAIYPDGSSHIIGTFTIPSSTALKHTIKWVSFTTATLPDLTVFVPDITASDGQIDKKGIAEFTIEWVSRGAGQGTVTGMAWQGDYVSDTTYAADDLVQHDGSTYLSLQAHNTGNDPVTDGGNWALVAQAGADGADGAGVAAGGATGQILQKLSGADFDTGWTSAGSGTVTHSGGALTADRPVFGAGTADIKVGTKSGNTNQVATVQGTLIPGNLAMVDGNGNLANGGVPGDYVPLTTKGDLVTFDSDVARLPVGTDGQGLISDSTQTTGVRWAGGSGVTVKVNGAAASYDWVVTVNGGITING